MMTGRSSKANEISTLAGSASLLHLPRSAGNSPPHRRRGSRRDGGLPSSFAPSGLTQAVEHVGVVFGPHPGGALADIHVKHGWRDRDRLIQCLSCLFDATELTERSGEPSVGQRELRE